VRFLPLLLFASLLSSVGCSKQITTGLAVDNAFRPLISPDTTVLAGAQLDAFKATPFYQRHQKSLEFPLLNASTEKLGLDPRRDLSAALISWNGRQSLFLVRGRFKPEAIEQKLTAQGLPKTRYRNYTLIGERGTVITLLKGSVAAAGSPEALRAALDRQEEGKGEIPEELQERLRSLPKGEQIWAVSRGGLPFADLPMRSDAESALSNIASYVRGTSLGIGVDTGLHLQGFISCISEQGAQRVNDALRGAIGLARLTTKDNELDLLRLYDAFQVTKDHEVVRLQADLPAELADKLFTFLPRLNGLGTGPLRSPR
jgi:hypothetical protein